MTLEDLLREAMALGGSSEHLIRELVDRAVLRAGLEVPSRPRYARRRVREHAAAHPGTSARELARLFAVDPRSVARWLRNGKKPETASRRFRKGA